jgi:RimJ/RimL family protein N-acetyltransferase
MEIRVLTADDAATYRSIRLRALHEHPEAFGMSVEEQQAVSVEQIAMDIRHSWPDKPRFGAFLDGQLTGIVGLYRQGRIKSNHRIYLVGMYVAPEARGHGAGRALVKTALDHARSLSGVEHVHLSVTAGNETARKLYESFGFRVWGIEPDYLKIDGRYYAMEWMLLRLVP